MAFSCFCREPESGSPRLSIKPPDPRVEDFAWSLFGETTGDFMTLLPIWKRAVLPFVAMFALTACSGGSDSTLDDSANPSDDEKADDSDASEDGSQNVLMIVVDDLGFGDLASYGSPVHKTDHIDQLASEGVRFTSGYATAATCSPSRAAILTGQYQQRSGFEYNTGPFDSERGLDSGLSTIADSLQEEGYATGLVGKWHVGKLEEQNPTNRGFDEFYGILDGASRYRTNPDKSLDDVYRGTVQEPLTEGYLTQAFADEATDFIDDHEDGA